MHGWQLCPDKDKYEAEGWESKERVGITVASEFQDRLISDLLLRE